MMLSDSEILEAIANGEIDIQPFNKDALGPCSVDLTLDSVFLVYHPGEPIDVRLQDPSRNNTELVDTGGEPFVIRPHQFILGQTRETVAVSPRLAALLEGRSSIARFGIIVHAAGLVNPGTGAMRPGKLTLEIFCENESPVILYPGMRIVQIMFVRLGRTATITYDKRPESKYVGQQLPSIRPISGWPDQNRDEE